MSSALEVLSRAVKDFRADFYLADVAKLSKRQGASIVLAYTLPDPSIDEGYIIATPKVSKMFDAIIASNEYEITHTDAFAPYTLYTVKVKDKYLEVLQRLSERKIAIGAIDKWTVQSLMDRGIEPYMRGVDGIAYMTVNNISAALARYISILTYHAYKEGVVQKGMFSKRLFSDTEPTPDDSANTSKAIKGKVKSVNRVVGTASDMVKDGGRVEDLDKMEGEVIARDGTVSNAEFFLTDQRGFIEAVYGNNDVLKAVNGILELYHPVVASPADSLGRFLTAYALWLDAYKDSVGFPEEIVNSINTIKKLTLDRLGKRYEGKPVGVRVVRKEMERTILPITSDVLKNEMSLIIFLKKLISEGDKYMQIIFGFLEERNMPQAALREAYTEVANAINLLEDTATNTEIGRLGGKLYGIVQKVLSAFPVETSMGKGMVKTLREMGIDKHLVVYKTDISVPVFEGAECAALTPRLAHQQNTPVKQMAAWILMLAQIDRAVAEGGYEGGIDMGVFGYKRIDGGKLPAFSAITRGDVRKIVEGIDVFAKDALVKLYNYLMSYKPLQLFERFYALYGFFASSQSQLLDHQIRAFEKILGAYTSGKKGFILAHATGTGKSYVMSAFLAYVLGTESDKKVLLVAPKQVLAKMRDEIANYALRDGISLPPLVIANSGKEIQKIMMGEKPRLLGMSFDGFAGPHGGDMAFYEIIRHYDVLLVDEAHFGKNLRIIDENYFRVLAGSRGGNPEDYNFTRSPYGYSLPDGYWDNGSSRRAMALFAARHANPDAFFLISTATPASNSTHDIWGLAYCVGVPDTIIRRSPYELAGEVIGVNITNFEIVYPRQMSDDMIRASRDVIQRIIDGGWMDAFTVSDAQEAGILPPATRRVELIEPSPASRAIMEANNVLVEAVSMSTALAASVGKIKAGEFYGDIDEARKVEIWDIALRDFMRDEQYRRLLQTLPWLGQTLPQFLKSPMLYPDREDTIDFNSPVISGFFKKLMFYHYGLAVFQSQLMAGQKLVDTIPRVLDIAEASLLKKLRGSGTGKILVLSQYRIPITVYAYSLLKFYTYAKKGLDEGREDIIAEAAEKTKEEMKSVIAYAMAAMQVEDERKLLLVPHMARVYQDGMGMIARAVNDVSYYSTNGMSERALYNLFYAMHIGRALMHAQKSFTDRGIDKSRFDEAPVKIWTHAKAWYRKNAGDKANMPVEIIFTGLDKVTEENIASIVNNGLESELLAYMASENMLPRELLKMYADAMGIQVKAYASNKKYEISKRFMDLNSGLHAVVGGLTTIGFGLNFHVADYLVVADFPFQFGSMLQGEGRVIRYSAEGIEKEPVEIVYMCMDVDFDRSMLIRLAQREQSILGTTFSQDLLDQIQKGMDRASISSITGETTAEVEERIDKAQEVIEAAAEGKPIPEIDEEVKPAKKYDFRTDEPEYFKKIPIFFIA